VQKWSKEEVVILSDKRGVHTRIIVKKVVQTFQRVHSSKPVADDENSFYLLRIHDVIVTH
jgi:hypothetical protein